MKITARRTQDKNLLHDTLLAYNRCRQPSMFARNGPGGSEGGHKGM